MGPQESWDTHADCGAASGAPGNTGNSVNPIFSTSPASFECCSPLFMYSCDPPLSQQKQHQYRAGGSEAVWPKNEMKVDMFP